jgi:hypothetical protein
MQTKGTAGPFRKHGELCDGKPGIKITLVTRSFLFRSLWLPGPVLSDFLQQPFEVYVKIMGKTKVLQSKYMQLKLLMLFNVSRP